ncbi:MAG: DUF3194 domain-containing protein [Halorhabdus sp.]
MTEADDPDVSDESIVQTAAQAAENVVFSRFDRSTVEDLDVTVSFEEGVLKVDVYIDAPEGQADVQRVVDDAALAARSAVDDLLSA